jgi:hypothetical protein
MTQVGLSYSIQTLLQVGQAVQVLFEVFSFGANSKSKILEGEFSPGVFVYVGFSRCTSTTLGESNSVITWENLQSYYGVLALNTETDRFYDGCGLEGWHSVWGSRSDRQLYSIRYRLCSDVEVSR